MRRLALVCASALLAAAPLHAQRGGRTARNAAPADSATAAASPFRSLRWRLVGPFRGGRVVAVTGDPADRGTFYFGAPDGGVWKTTNGGISWRNVTDGKADVASVGAIAVAPSDPNVIYVGGGEAEPREDLTYGEGVWRSTDAGESWTHLGLEATQQVGDIVVDPRDPDRVYVAALGHAFGPNPERGVYRSEDGGAHWEKVLFVNDSTGAIDLAMDPRNPRILYAAMWKFERMPWGFGAGGGRSGLWKSSDGGDTWKELSFNPGMPKGPLGRIGIDVSPADPQRLYASIEAPDSAGGIFRSDDAGASWRRVNADQEFMIRPWYFSRVTADPEDPNVVYVLNLGTMRSEDGGRTFSEMRVPHGDCHLLWIDPNDPDRMIEGNDGGAVVSYDRGDSWSSVMTQPTAQFYHVVTDSQFPYRIYGAQQDNSTVSIPSRGDDGYIPGDDFYDVGGGESGYVAPKPGEPDVVFAGSYMGTMTRYDHRTKQAQDVSVGLNNYDGWPAAQVPYRFQWTFPIVFSPHDPNTLYTAAQYVFRSTNGGQSWEKISPDLTLHDPATMGPVGGPVTLDMTGTEWYATIFAFAESPVEKGVLWAGSDDGLVHVSRDGGASWQNVTPGDMAHFTRVSIVEPSHFDAGTAYVAANRYQLDDFRPYLWKTSDYGRTWTRIDAGIPTGAYTRSIREDPERRGLLYAGTETGIYVSFDDGAHWQSLQLNLPKASVRDMTLHGSDLIVATHGRAFWVLDDISPLRAWSDSLSLAPVTLLPPQPAIRYAGAEGRRSPSDAGQNPPNGVIVDYHLATAPQGEVKLEFLDGAGEVIRSFSSREAEAADTAKPLLPDTGRVVPLPPDTAFRGRARARIEQEADSVAFIPGDSIVPARAGFDRFTWTLRYPSAEGLDGIVVDEGTLSGPRAVPGRYSVRLTVDGTSTAQPFTVVEDPRIQVSEADLAAQFALAQKVHDRIDSLTAAVRRIEDVQTRLGEWTAAAKGKPYATQLGGAARALSDTLEVLERRLVCVHCHADESTLNYPIMLYNKLLSLNEMVLSADAAPTRQEAAVLDDLGGQLDAELARLREVESTQLARFNALVRELNVPGVAARR